PRTRTLSLSSAIRSSCIFSAEPGCSTAGLRMSPASPPVQQTSTLCTPSAAYFAVVPAPFDPSSSGCACTWTKQRTPMPRTLPNRLARCGLNRADAPQLPDSGRMTLESVGRQFGADRGGREHLAIGSFAGQTTREIDDRAVVVAAARNHRTGRDAD